MSTMEEVWGGLEQTYYFLDIEKPSNLDQWDADGREKPDFAEFGGGGGDAAGKEVAELPAASTKEEGREEVEPLAIPAASTEEEFARWFPKHKSTATAEPRLIVLCFPAAGCSESLYTTVLRVRDPETKKLQQKPNELLAWATDNRAEVWAVEYPGREQRRKEKPHTSAASLAAALFPVIAHRLQTLNVPFVILSHSVGTWISFETLKLLKRAQIRAPAHYIVSGFPAPTIGWSDRPWKKNEGMDDIAFKQECRGWNINEAALTPDMWTQYCPLFHADFSMFDTFPPEPADSWFQNVDAPMTAFSATRDQKITRPMVESWAKYAQQKSKGGEGGGAGRGDFDVRDFEGHHLFLFDFPSRSLWYEQILEICNRYLD